MRKAFAFGWAIIWVLTIVVAEQMLTGRYLLTGQPYPIDWMTWATLGLMWLNVGMLGVFAAAETRWRNWTTVKP